MQLAAWELGIGSCIASMWEPEKAKAILGVPQDLHFDVAISFGYPLPGHEQSHAPKPNGRKPFDEVIFWEHWGDGALCHIFSLAKALQSQRVSDRSGKRRTRAA